MNITPPTHTYAHTIYVWVLTGNKTASRKIRVLCFCCNFLSMKLASGKYPKPTIRVNINDTTRNTLHHLPSLEILIHGVWMPDNCGLQPRRLPSFILVYLSASSRVPDFGFVTSSIQQNKFSLFLFQNWLINLEIFILS